MREQITEAVQSVVSAAVLKITVASVHMDSLVRSNIYTNQVLFQNSARGGAIEWNQFDQSLWETTLE